MGRQAGAIKPASHVVAGADTLRIVDIRGAEFTPRGLEPGTGVAALRAELTVEQQSHCRSCEQFTLNPPRDNHTCTEWGV
jgi:hypothetical protein